MHTTDNIAVDLDEADQQDFAARVREPDERPEFDEQIAFCEPANPAPVVKPKSKSAARSQAEIVKLLYECALTEDGLAEAFKAKHNAQILYDHDCGLWYVYHKGVWRQRRQNWLSGGSPSLPRSRYAERCRRKA
jgi:hypothetical protein